MTCDLCPADAEVVVVGSEEIREAGILLVRGEPQRNYCLCHAKEAGFPWLTSEKQRVSRRA